MTSHDIPSSTQLPESSIDAYGHIIRSGAAHEGDEDYNPKIEVFSGDIEGDRAQVYQMWAIDKFASNEVAHNATVAFGLAGENADSKENWTQLLEHVSGVVANTLHFAGLLQKYGVKNLDLKSIEEASLYDSIQKPAAIENGVNMRRDIEALETAALVHDTFKNKEVDAAKVMSGTDRPGGLENSRDNPAVNDELLWDYLRAQGVSETVIIAAKNTGRADRYFSNLDRYDDKGIKKAYEDWEKLAAQLGVDRDDIEAMTPNERRDASIDAKGLIATSVGFNDAMSAQAKLRGYSDEVISDTATFYTDTDRNPYAKTDPESRFFFGEDWPGYYKRARVKFIELVAEDLRPAFIQELDSITYQTVFNETILPGVLGKATMQRAAELHAAGEPNIYDTLRYPEN